MASGMQIGPCPIGNVYLSETDQYAPVTVEMKEDDEAPQIYIEVPLRILDENIRHNLCVWVTAEGAKRLGLMILEVEMRLEHLRKQNVVE